MRKIPAFLLVFPAIILMTSCADFLPLTSASNSTPAQSSDTMTSKVLKYEDYAAVLATYVNEKGLVDYSRLQNNRQQLDAFNASVAAVTPDEYASWNSAEQIAFWMNAYNSLTLQSIIDQKPIKKSIKDIFGVWRIKKWPILDQEKTLDNIEHQTLRANFNEPRLHVALVCAAISCPPLRNEPYNGEQLDAQLDDQTRQFIASPQGFRIDKEQGIVYLSKIFDWYGDDWITSYGIQDKFTGNEGQRAVLNFLSGYLPPAEQEYLAQGAYQIKYLNYDWSLNQQ